jgi:chaperonin GroES
MVAAKKPDFQPFEDFCLIEPMPLTETPGGVILPQKGAQEQAQSREATKARVIRCGPGRRLENGELVPMPVKEGDLIIFGGLGMSPPFELDGRVYFLTQACQMFGKFES